MVDNVVAYVYAKFGDDREMTQPYRVPNNKNRNKKKVGGVWRPYRV